MEFHNGNVFYLTANIQIIHESCARCCVISHPITPPPPISHTHGTQISHAGKDLSDALRQNLLQDRQFYNAKVMQARQVQTEDLGVASLLVHDQIEGPQRPIG